MEKLKVGIVGCGSIAVKRHLPAFLKLKKTVTVAAVCDTDEGAAQQTARQYGIQKTYLNFTEMLAQETLNILDICTPPQTHAPLALEGMQHGCHILLEKPMALKVSDCDLMVEASRQSGVKLCVIHNMLFCPPLLKAKELVARGAIGTFIGMRIFISDPRDEVLLQKDGWIHQLPGGILEESVAHPVYISLAFLNRIDNVAVVAKNFTKHPWTPFDEFRIELAGEKAISSIVKSYASRGYAAEVDLFGTEGALHLDLHSMLLVHQKSKKSLTPLTLAYHSLNQACQISRGIVTNAWKVLTGQARFGQDLIIPQFVDCIINNTPSPVTGEEGRETVRIIEMIIQKLPRD